MPKIEEKVTTMHGMPEMFPGDSTTSLSGKLRAKTKGLHKHPASEVCECCHGTGKIVQNCSPLHPEALTKDDLVPGMKVQFYHDGQPVTYRGIAVIIGAPYMDTDWKVRAVEYVEWHKHKLVVTEIYLADRGMTPYDEWPNGHWNESNYTLALPKDNLPF